MKAKKATKQLKSGKKLPATKPLAVDSYMQFMDAKG